jgi:hypothetical protein
MKSEKLTPTEAANIAVAAIWGAVAGAVAMAWLLIVVIGR